MMKKVGFFRSVHFKFVLIYVLLILVAMQIIGVYFVRQLESQLVSNFTTSLTERINLLSYNMEQEMVKERDENMPVLEDDIRRILKDFNSEDIHEVRVIDSKSKVIGTSDVYNQSIVGKRTTEILIVRTLVVGETAENILIDPNTGRRNLVRVTPIKHNDEVIGAIYFVASMQPVFDQMMQINNILATGTVIALVITAVLGIWLARTITRPISDMRKHALAMAKGNFSRKVKVYGYDEIGELALTFNNLTKKLQEAHATTEGERRKLSSVLTYMTDGVMATDRKGRIILINDRALELLNVSRETVINEPIVSVLGLEERYTYESLLAEQEYVILDYSTPNDHFILRANFSVIQKETGFVNGLISVLHDITDQEKIEIMRREFVANVSHELRTPLTTMRSYLEALAEGGWKDQDLAPHFLEVTQTETERMIRLVNDLLQLSKIDSTEQKYNMEWIDFIRYYHRIIDRFEMSKAQHVSFVRALPKKAIFTEIDVDKVTQVLDNIISNALKYSPEGGRITFRVSERDNHIVVSVSDQGMGIPKESLAKIFQRFYRVDKARSRQMGGTGLGLAIAKEVVEAHNGEIWATSEEGIGTTIYFSLPLSTEQEEEWEE